MKYILLLSLCSFLFVLTGCSNEQKSSGGVRAQHEAGEKKSWWGGNKEKEDSSNKIDIHSGM